MASRPHKKTATRKRKRVTKRSLNAKLLREHRQFYDALLELQGGVCALCKRTPEQAYARSLEKARKQGVRNPKPPRFNMDHDWEKMVIRGLLCASCNRKLPDRMPVEWVENLADYLRNPPFARLTTK